MYFASRTVAGQQLAAELAEKYRYEDAVVLALSEGGVVVGAQIAAQLHCPLTLLLTEDITLPGERSALGVVDQNGGFTYNDMFSPGELEELETEFRNVIEQQKMERWHAISRILGEGGILTADIVRDRVIILASDGLTSALSLMAAVNYLKPISYRRLIIATPFATIEAVDKMHILTDEIRVLSVVTEPFDIDRHYESQDVPTKESIIAILNNAILHWQ